MRRKLIATLGALMLSVILAFSGTILEAKAAEVPTAYLELLGKFIFFDTNLSSPNGQACSSCHLPETGFADPNRNTPVSQGVIGTRFGDRNAPSVAYARYSPTLHWDPTPTQGNMMQGMYVGGLFWDGRADSLEDQAKGPPLNILEMNNPDKESVVNAIRDSQYAFFFKYVFGPTSLDNVETAFQYMAQAIAAFERSSEVTPFTSKYDYYLDGKVQLSASEKHGLELFTGNAKCVNCHSMDNPDPARYLGLKPLFTNFGYQNIGAPANPENPYYFLPPELNPLGTNFVDFGLGAHLAAIGDPNAGVPNASAQKQNGKFKIPSLRNCAITPPYEHNGVFQTLREVVMFNNTRDVMGAGWPPPEVPQNVHRHMPMVPGFFGMLGLTDQEVDDIVAFLGTLTDGYRLRALPFLPLLLLND